MNSTANTTHALALALKHNPYLTRRVGLLSRDLSSLLQKVAPQGKAIAAEAKLERERDNGTWEMMGLSIRIEGCRHRAADHDCDDNDFHAQGYVPNWSTGKLLDLWVSKKTIESLLAFLQNCHNDTRFVCEKLDQECACRCYPSLEDFAVLKVQRRLLPTDHRGSVPEEGRKQWTDMQLFLLFRGIKEVNNYVPGLGVGFCEWQWPAECAIEGFEADWLKHLDPNITFLASINEGNGLDCGPAKPSVLLML